MPIIACKFVYSPSRNIESPSIDSPIEIGSEIDYTPGVWEDEESVSVQAWRSLTENGVYSPVGDEWDSLTGTPYIPLGRDYGYYIKIIETAFPGRATSESTPIIVTVPPVTFEVTTTAPGQTYTIHGFTVSGTVNVNWGDNSSNNYNGAGARTHNYAAAGTYMITIDKPLLVTNFYVRDTKTSLITGENISYFRNLTYLSLDVSVLTWIVSLDAPMPTGLIYLYLYNMPDFIWEIGEDTPMPTGLIELDLFSLPELTWWVNTFNSAPENLSYLGLYNLPGLTWTVSSNATFGELITIFYLDNLPNFVWEVNESNPLSDNITYISVYSTDGFTWEINSDNNLPSALNYLDLNLLPNVTIDSTIEFTNAMNYVNIDNNLSESEVDLILTKLYSVFPTRTGVNGTIDISGTNAAPSGILQAACPPTTGKEYAYELKNDSCAVSANNWATVTTN